MRDFGSGFLMKYFVKRYHCFIMLLVGIFYFGTGSLSVLGQSDSTKRFSYSAFADLYYSYDFGNPSHHEKPNFIYNHKRHNELNVNLLLLKGAFVDTNYRANLGIMGGNYARYNLSSEPIWAQFIYEANVGIKLSKRRNIWLDAGIMPSHIGFESAISGDCWTLTRSMLAENSPYYEAGIKLTYTTQKERLRVAGLVLNGWQRIHKPDAQQLPALGLQITYKPHSKFSINYSNFWGSVGADSLQWIRQYHNFYLQFEPHNSFGIIAGYDIGTDKFPNAAHKIWYSPVLILRLKTAPKSYFTLRGEYYSDPKQVMVFTGTANGFKTTGISGNFDINIGPQTQFRMEAKWFQSKDLIFNQNTQSTNYSITGSLSFKI